MSGLKLLGRRAAELAQAGRHGEVVSLCERAHRLAPADPRVSMALGNALIAADRNADAAQWLASACGRHPTHAGLLRLLAHALIRLKQHGPALGALFTALALEPGSVETKGLLANALYWERASSAALPFAEAACRADPTDLNVATYVSILIDLARFEEAVDVAERQIMADPEGRASLLLTRAAALQAAGRLEAGMEAAREAVRLAPENQIARHHLASALLLSGHLTPEAWAHYEGRAGLLKLPHWPEPERCWSGQDVTGRTVLVHAEQGLGDTLQFVRYMPLLAARGARIILAVQSSLVGLLRNTPGVSLVVAAGSRLPAFDFYCPLLSLPGRFATTIATIPPQLGYRIDLPEPPRQARLQVGVVWEGQKTFVEDRRRSLDPALLAPLGAVGGVDFHSLQYGAAVLPLPNMRDAMQGVGDFADTARRIAMLDLVIAVDTSVAHLAATMGKPVWLLARANGCWRWLLEREDSPWYPSVRLFRQTRPGEWAPVLERVRAELVLAAAERVRSMALAA